MAPCPATNISSTAILEDCVFTIAREQGSTVTDKTTSRLCMRVQENVVTDATVTVRSRGKGRDMRCGVTRTCGMDSLGGRRLGIMPHDETTAPRDSPRV